MSRHAQPPPGGGAAVTANAPGGRVSEAQDTSAKAIHLHLARMAGVDVDLILGDLAQMGWSITDDDVEFLAEFPLARSGAGR